MLYRPLFLALAFAAPASAQEVPKPFTVSGSAALVSDYRYRGVSQSDKAMAVQAGLTVTHESGFYIGTWGSNLAGWGQFGGANMELDLIGGYKRSFGGWTIDAGLTWYMYPAGADNTDFAEPYIKASYAIGPVNLLAGVAYAPKQEALGNFSNTPQSRGQKQDNTYVWGDVSTGIPGTPLTAKAHLGYSWGNPGLGPNGTSVTPTGKYLDYLIDLDATVLSRITLGVAYVGTDISKKEAAYLQPNFSRVKDGSSIAGGRAVFSVSTSF